MTKPEILRLQNVSKVFAKGSFPAVDRVTLRVLSGTIVGVLGPSGCGKTTLLRLIAGFEQLSQGTISINRQQVAAPHVCLPPEKRGIGMVFQDFALFPHLTVAENISFGLSRPKFSTSVSRQRVQELLRLIRLEHVSQRYPHELSGGQQQRVALARALAPQPRLVLLDEPLSNLDLQVRLQLRTELRSILKASGATAIFVTHDQEEAMSLADEIAVMRCGRVEQIGSPRTVYDRPETAFVAEFMAQANFLEAHFEQDAWHTEIGSFPAHLCQGAQPHAELQTVVMIREEDLSLEADPGSQFTVCDRQFLGREYRYKVSSNSGLELHARCLRPDLEIGAAVNLRVLNSRLSIFQKTMLSSPDQS